MVDGAEQAVTIEINTEQHDVHLRRRLRGALRPGLLPRGQPRQRREAEVDAIQTADGQVRIETRFSLADYLKLEDLFAYGMVPQFMARFDNVVLLRDLDVAGPQGDPARTPSTRRSRAPAATSRSWTSGSRSTTSPRRIIAEEAEKNSRTGARALRTVFGKIINPLEFDPWQHEGLEETDTGTKKLRLTAGIGPARTRPRLDVRPGPRLAGGGMNPPLGVRGQSLRRLRASSPMRSSAGWSPPPLGGRCHSAGASGPPTRCPPRRERRGVGRRRRGPRRRAGPSGTRGWPPGRGQHRPGATLNSQSTAAISPAGNRKTASSRCGGRKT